MSDRTDSTAPHWFALIYQEFLLRDVFGKVVPGLLLILALFTVATNVETVVNRSVQLAWWIWLFAVGPAWLFGFAVQSIGEFLKLIRPYPAPAPAPAPALSEEQHFKAAYAGIQSMSGQRTAIRRHFERFVVIKEACGNGAVSLGLALLLNVVADTLRLYRHEAVFSPYRLVVVAMLVVTAVALWRMHRHHVRRQQWFMEVALTSPASSSLPGDS